MVKKYGLPMLVTADESVKEYLQTILQQVQGGSIILISSAARLSLCRAHVRMASVIQHHPPSARDKIRRDGRNPRTMAIRHSHRRVSRNQWPTARRRKTTKEEGEDGKGCAGRDQGDHEADHVECDVPAHLGGGV